MAFVKKQVDVTPIEDTVFAIVKLAKQAIMEKGDDAVVNATIGSLYGEDGRIVAYDSVFGPYDRIKKEVKAAYAASFTGNESYRKQVYEWVCGDNKLHLAHSVIATAGGSGAVSIAINEMLDEGQTLVIPKIAWGSYALMACMHNVAVTSYELFDGDRFHLRDFERVCREVMEKQHKLLVVINDPCHNPTGYSMSMAEWKQVIDFLNELSALGDVVILNDVAYIDYAYQKDARAYLSVLNEMNAHVMCIVAFSCSKTLTSYGLRCGAALLLAKDAAQVREVEIVFEKMARSLWSNIPNAAMENFTYVTTIGRDAFLQEKQEYVELLRKRSACFIEEAEACALPCYPYKEGFFVTVKMPDNQTRDRFHEALMKQDIYTVKVNTGIRVAICSLPLKKCEGLAKRMKEIYVQVEAER